MPKRSSPKANIPRETVEKAIAALEELPVKPKAVLPAAEVIEMMRDQIMTALKEKNYTYEEVSEMLASQGMEIRPASLRYYLTRKKPAGATITRTHSTRKTSRKSPAPKASRKRTKTSETVMSEPEPIAVEPTEPTEPMETPTTVEVAASTPEPDAPKKRTARSTTKGTRKTAAKRKTTSTTRSKTSPGKTTDKTTGKGRRTSTTSRRRSSKSATPEAASDAS
jgi:hypothetical protein